MLEPTSKPGREPSGTASEPSGVGPFAEPKRKRAEWPPERMAVLQELYDAGLSHLLIAEALGIDKGAVSAKLARLGWRRGETTTSARRSSAGPVHNRTPQPIKRRTVFSGQALQVGGNRADLLLRDVLACIDKRMGRK